MNNLPAVGYMLLAVLGFSLTPLFIELVSGYRSPFLFNALFRAGASAGCLLFLLARCPGSGLDRGSWRVILGWVFCWSRNRLLILSMVVTRWWSPTFSSAWAGERVRVGPGSTERLPLQSPSQTRPFSPGLISQSPGSGLRSSG